MVEKVTKWKILFPYLSDYRKSLILADFERELDKPHQTLKKYIQQLIDKNILRIEGEGKHRKYRLNTECALIFHYLSVAEKMRTDIFLEKDTLVRRLYEKLLPFMSEARFVVFGSYAVEREGEDIDLMIVGEEEKGLDEVLEEFGDVYIPVHKTHVESKEGLHRRFKKELHKKHIILNGTDYFVRLFGEMYGELGLV